MNTNIKKAIELIDSWEIAQFFEFIKEKRGENEMLNRLAKKFIYDKYDENFADQLRLLATWLLDDNEIESKNAKNKLVEKGTITIQDAQNVLAGNTFGNISGGFQVGNNFYTSEQASEYDIFLPTLYSYTHNQQADTSLPLAGKTVETLSKKALKKLFAQEKVKKHFQKHKITAKTDTNKKLKALNLMSNGLVLKGTFLCLASVEQIRSVSQNADTSKFFSFEDTEGLRTSITEFVQGNLIEQFEQMIGHIKQNLYLVRDIDSRTEDYQIPEKVFTELLANAFIHRSYANDTLSPTKVELYPNRMEIYNAGKFAEGIDLEKIAEIENSVVINREIVQLFFLHTFVETSAKGIRRSQEKLKEKQMQPAVFEQKNGYVKVTIYKKKTVSTSADLDHAYALLAENRIADFFDWTEKYGKNETIEALKNDFIAGKTDPNFKERLKLLAKMLLK